MSGENAEKMVATQVFEYLKVIFQKMICRLVVRSLVLIDSEAKLIGYDETPIVEVWKIFESGYNAKVYHLYKISTSNCLRVSRPITPSHFLHKASESPYCTSHFRLLSRNRTTPLKRVHLQDRHGIGRKAERDI